MAVTLRVADLVKNYGTTNAVRAVSLDVAAGERLAMVGPSGCGKSTILRVVAGLDTATSGSVSIGGRDVTHLPAGRRNVGMVFQHPAAFPYLTVAENLAYGMKVRRVPIAQRKRRVVDMAELLDIAGLLDRRPNQLSGGEQQRVEIGRALLRDPDVLLLDEPFSSLDAALRIELRDQVARIQREVGTTTVVVTHDQIEATVLGDRVAVMRDGQIAQLGHPAELYDTPANTFVARFIGSPPMNLVPGVVTRTAVDIGAVQLPLPHAARPGPVTVGIRPTDLEPTADGSLCLVVDVLEDHGADHIVHGRLAGAPESVHLRARLSREHSLRPGDEVRLAARRLHLFDPSTGARTGL
jgi:ABC-type sugar transport system ATPase subunit